LGSFSGAAKAAPFPDRLISPGHRSMGYTRRKIRAINLSFFLAAAIFTGWALFCARTGLPHSFPHGGAAGFALFGTAALFFASFPLIWARFPGKHPVNHELMRYGSLSEISSALDKEMSGSVDALGPFRFTANFLIYNPSYEFQMIPFDQIASVDVSSEDGAAGIAVRTRKGRSYLWFSTWMQGRFDPEEVVERIRACAELEKSVPTAKQA
jgi:hypothetical protein